MVPTPGFWACDDMGAALAGVFCGVLVTGALDLGTSILGGVCAVLCACVEEAQKKCVAGHQVLTERRWSPSSCCGLAQTSWRFPVVDVRVADC